MEDQSTTPSFTIYIELEQPQEKVNFDLLNLSKEDKARLEYEAQELMREMESLFYLSDDEKARLDTEAQELMREMKDSFNLSEEDRAKIDAEVQELMNEFNRELEMLHLKNRENSK